MEPFDYRSYGLFAWLAGVRNYSAIEPIAEPRGLPDDMSPEVRAASVKWSEWGCGDESWLAVSELLSADYDREIIDRRRNGDTLPPEQGKRMTLRDFLGPRYFEEVEALRREHVERIVFWFDS